MTDNAARGYEPAPAEGTGRPLKDLHADAETLSPGDFADRHGPAFLVRAPDAVEHHQGPGATIVNLSFDPDRPRMAPAVQDDRLAYPIVRGAQSVTPLITIGRTPNNDIVIPDLSVSRFHAFLKNRADGGFQIQDAGSSNGTMVNEVAAPMQGQGPVVDLEPGDRVTLGRVELKFFDAAALQQLVTGQR